MIRIGITGAGGVLGRSVRRWWPGLECIPYDGDIRDVAALRRWVGDGGFDAVFHFAAIVPLVRVEADPLAAFDVNVRGTWLMLEALRETRAWVFVASSSHVYAPAPDPIAETATPAPLSLYGLTKLHAEQAATALAERFGIPLCVGRIFSFSGPGQSDLYLLPSLVARIRGGAPESTLPLRGAMSVRDFLTTRQIVSAIECLFRARAKGVFNIGTGQGTTVLDLANAVAKRLGRSDVGFEWEKQDRTESLVADATKLRQLGWEARRTLDEMIDDVLRDEG